MAENEGVDRLPEPGCCARCGRGIAPGSLFYRVKLSVTSGDDGFLDGDAPENQRAGLSRVLASVEARSAGELLAEVHRERELVMCRRCADEAWDVVALPIS